MAMNAMDLPTHNNSVSIFNVTTDSPPIFVYDDATTTPFEGVFYVLYTAVFFLCFIGNGSVIHVLVQYKPMDAITTAFMVNIAVSDLMRCLVQSVIFLSITVKNTWVFGPRLCRILPAALTANLFAVTLTLVALAVDRSYVVALNQRRLNVKVCLAAIWLSSIVLGIPDVVFHQRIVLNPNAEDTVYTCIFDELASTIIAIITLLLCFIVPYIVMAVMYVLNYRALADRERRPIETKDVLVNKHRQTNNLLVTMTFTYVACWLPLAILNVVPTRSVELEVSIYVFHVFTFLAVCSSVINPFFYSFFPGDFRMKMRRYIPCLYSHFCCRRIAAADRRLSRQLRESRGMITPLK